MSRCRSVSSMEAINGKVSAAYLRRRARGGHLFAFWNTQKKNNKCENPENSIIVAAVAWRLLLLRWWAVAGHLLAGREHLQSGGLMECAGNTECYYVARTKRLTSGRSNCWGNNIPGTHHEDDSKFNTAPHRWRMINKGSDERTRKRVRRNNRRRHFWRSVDDDERELYFNQEINVWRKFRTCRTRHHRPLRSW